MAAVVFAFGSRPGVPEQDARELARLLELRRSLAGHTAAQKIRGEADRDPDHEPSRDVELTADELVELSVLLAEEPWPKEQDWYTHVREELNRYIGPAEH